MFIENKPFHGKQTRRVFGWSIEWHRTVGGHLRVNLTRRREFGGKAIFIPLWPPAWPFKH